MLKVAERRMPWMALHRRQWWLPWSGRVWGVQSEYLEMAGATAWQIWVRELFWLQKSGQVRPELPTPRGGLAMAAPTSDANGNGRAVVVALGGRRTSGEKLDVESTSVSNGVSFQAQSSHGLDKWWIMTNLMMSGEAWPSQWLGGYDVHGGSWTRLASLSSPRDGCCACALLGQVYVFGGRGTTGSSEGLPFENFKVFHAVFQFVMYEYRGCTNVEINSVAMYYCTFNIHFSFLYPGYLSIWKASFKFCFWLKTLILLLVTLPCASVKKATRPALQEMLLGTYRNGHYREPDSGTCWTLEQSFGNCLRNKAWMLNQHMTGPDRVSCNVKLGSHRTQPKERFDFETGTWSPLPQKLGPSTAWSTAWISCDLQSFLPFALPNNSK